MVSTFTPNIQLEEPARGDQVGTWDTPVNSNMTELDLTIGGAATISLNNSPVVLATAQFQAKTITFNSTLTGSVAITFPTSFTKSYEIRNVCTGSSAFVITLQTTAASAQVVCAPPGEAVDIINIGGNLIFKNLGRVGGYWDYAGSSVPAWVSGCSVPPYLNCDGTTFSAATFPTLAVILGSTTLPDRRGSVGVALNQGTGRLTTALGGLDGNTRGALKTTQVTLSTSNLPAYTPSGTVTLVNGGSPLYGFITPGANVGFGGTATGGSQTLITSLLTASFAGTAQGGVSNVLPVGSATVYGITMIRAG